MFAVFGTYPTGEIVWLANVGNLQEFAEQEAAGDFDREDLGHVMVVPVVALADYADTAPVWYAPSMPPTGID